MQDAQELEDLGSFTKVGKPFRFRQHLIKLAGGLRRFIIYIEVRKHAFDNSRGCRAREPAYGCKARQVAGSIKA